MIIMHCHGRKEEERGICTATSFHEIKIQEEQLPGEKTSVALGLHTCSREKSSRWLRSKRSSVYLSTESEKIARLQDAEFSLLCSWNGVRQPQRTQDPAVYCLRITPRTINVILPTRQRIYKYFLRTTPGTCHQYCSPAFQEHRTHCKKCSRCTLDNSGSPRRPALTVNPNALPLNK